MALAAWLFLSISESTILEERFPDIASTHVSASSKLQSGDLGICAPIEDIKKLNREIAPLLIPMINQPYFRTYKINLERECPFWAQQRLCNNDKCSVCECSAEEVPIFWKKEKTESQPVGLSGFGKISLGDGFIPKDDQ